MSPIYLIPIQSYYFKKDLTTNLLCELALISKTNNFYIKVIIIFISISPLLLSKLKHFIQHLLLNFRSHQIQNRTLALESFLLQILRLLWLFFLIQANPLPSSQESLLITYSHMQGHMTYCQYTKSKNHDNMDKGFLKIDILYYEML